MKLMPDKISDTDIRDVRVQHASTLILDEMNNNPEYKDFISQFADHGIEPSLSDKRVYLKPIGNLKALLISNGLSGMLEHIGVSNWDGSFNNIEQLESIGIFGKPYRDFPTFIRPIEFKTVPSRYYFGNKVRILIDSTKLSSKIILPDPEMYHPAVFRHIKTLLKAGISFKEIIELYSKHGEVPLASFMIMGGIPKEAIISIDQIAEL